MAEAVDTLQIARGLREAGVDRDQAEAHADAIASAVRKGQGDLATKADMAALRADMAALETRLTWRLVGVMLAGFGLLFAALQAWPPS